MHQIILIAGLSTLAHQRLTRESGKRLVPTGRLIAKPSSNGAYSQTVLNKFIDDVHQYIISLPEGTEISISALYVDFGDESTAALLSTLFPFALVRSIERCELDSWKTTNEQNAKANEYQAYLEVELAELRMRASLVDAKTKIHNLSPLLLPYRNFCSPGFKAMIQALYSSLGTVADPAKLLDDEIKKFELGHPRVFAPADGWSPRGQHCFCDNVLYFKSPGRNRHGYYRPARGGSHPAVCLLNARSRLGGSYSHSFHFDCQPVSGRLKKTYPNCHDHPTGPGQRHVNVAPNDYII